MASTPSLTRPATPSSAASTGRSSRWRSVPSTRSSTGAAACLSGTSRAGVRAEGHARALKMVSTSPRTQDAVGSICVTKISLSKRISALQGLCLMAKSAWMTGTIYVMCGLASLTVPRSSMVITQWRRQTVRRSSTVEAGVR